MADSIIRAEAISKIYKDVESEFQALDAVSLVIQESEMVGIIGSSGSGKTTLLGILGLLETPTTGALEIFGEDARKMNDSRLSEIRLNNVGFIFQDHNLLPALSIAENIELPLSLTNIMPSERKTRVKELLKSVGLEELASRYPSQLSRGQRQRVAALRALANNPKLIVADEPTSDLDPVNAKILLDLLKDRNIERGTTIIIAVTDQDAIKGYTTRNFRIEHGKLV